MRPCAPPRPPGFKEISESESHRAPESKRGKDLDNGLMERSFWSRWAQRAAETRLLLAWLIPGLAPCTALCATANQPSDLPGLAERYYVCAARHTLPLSPPPCSVTINPPFYGADTPQSFFDEKIEYGWNLRHLDVRGAALPCFDLACIRSVLACPTLAAFEELEPTQSHPLTAHRLKPFLRSPRAACCLRVCAQHPGLTSPMNPSSHTLFTHKPSPPPPSSGLPAA